MTDVTINLNLPDREENFGAYCREKVRLKRAFENAVPDAPERP